MPDLAFTAVPWPSAAGRQGGAGGGGHANNNARRFFDKVMRDGGATFDAGRDGAKFMGALMEFRDDPVDLLYRLRNPQVSREQGQGSAGGEEDAGRRRCRPLLASHSRLSLISSLLLLGLW